jgi:hypothetical protein
MCGAGGDARRRGAHRLMREGLCRHQFYPDETSTLLRAHLGREEQEADGYRASYKRRIERASRVMGTRI